MAKFHFRYNSNHGRWGSKPPRDHLGGKQKNTALRIWQSASHALRRIYILLIYRNKNVKRRALLSCDDLQSDVLDGAPPCKYPDGGVAYWMVRHFAITRRASLPPQVAYHLVGRLGSSRKATLTSQAASHQVRQGHCTSTRKAILTCQVVANLSRHWTSRASRSGAVFHGRIIIHRPSYNFTSQTPPGAI